MIKTVAENVEALGAGHSVDLSNPDRTIIIEVNKVCFCLFTAIKADKQNSLGVSVLQDYDTLKKVGTCSLQTEQQADDQYNVVEIAKAAAVAAGKTTESTEEVNEEVINRAAGEVGGQEKRKADGMDVDAQEGGDEDRAAKQLKVDQEQFLYISYYCICTPSI